MYFLYILRSENSGRYYIGATEDTDARLQLHNYGQVTSTRPYRPWQLIFRQAYATLSEARQAETHLKSMKKRRSIERFIQDHGKHSINAPTGL